MKTNMNTTQRTALVTGASAGIGAAFARHLASEGYALLLVARRVDRLEELAGELNAKYGVRCNVFAADLNDPAAPAEIMEYAQAQGIAVDVLINNAGLSGKTAFADTPWPKLAAEIQLMITALTELCHRVLPGMQERGWGRIINLSSLAAFSPPGASLLYTGIKGYVLSVSQSLDMELKPQGIHVTALCPGFTRSEFHDTMGTRDAANKLPDMLWQEADDVVREGWAAVMKGKPVCVPGIVNKVLASTMRPLPVSLQYHLGNRLNPFKEA
jgi:short-subunit dehydrogenase